MDILVPRPSCVCHLQYEIIYSEGLVHFIMWCLPQLLSKFDVAGNNPIHLFDNRANKRKKKLAVTGMGIKRSPNLNY